MNNAMHVWGGCMTPWMHFSIESLFIQLPLDEQTSLWREKIIDLALDGYSDRYHPHDECPHECMSTWTALSLSEQNG